MKSLFSQELFTVMQLLVKRELLSTSTASI